MEHGAIPNPQGGFRTSAEGEAGAKIAQQSQTLKMSEDGLSSIEAAERIAQSGPPAIEAKTESKWRNLLAYFRAPLPFLIEAAALISALRRDWPDFAVVTGLLIYNAVVGIWQDSKATNALAPLKKAPAPHARVLRNGNCASIAAAGLGPETLSASQQGRSSLATFC